MTDLEQQKKDCFDKVVSVLPPGIPWSDWTRLGLKMVTDEALEAAYRRGQIDELKNGLDILGHSPDTKARRYEVKARLAEREAELSRLTNLKDSQ